jgi:hypothetical protein
MWAIERHVYFLSFDGFVSILIETSIIINKNIDYGEKLLTTLLF